MDEFNSYVCYRLLLAQSNAKEGNIFLTMECEFEEQKSYDGLPDICSEETEVGLLCNEEDDVCEGKEGCDVSLKNGIPTEQE